MNDVSGYNGLHIIRSQAVRSIEADGKLFVRLATISPDTSLSLANKAKDTGFSLASITLVTMTTKGRAGRDAGSPFVYSSHRTFLSFVHSLVFNSSPRN